MAYALITGASKGIGKAIAQELAAKKIDLLLIARSVEMLEQVSGELTKNHGVKTAYLAIDLSEADAAQKVFNWCSANNFSINILVNNAGYGLSGAFDKYSLPENLNMLQLNMLVPVALTQLFLPQLLLQPQAYILNTASSAAYQSVPGLSLYAASKAFLLRFSRGLHQELKYKTVSVTCVSPGATDTDFVVRAQLGPKGLKAASQVNMTPEAVAKIAVKAMFQKKAEVITGTVNKLGAFLSWLLPKALVERTSMKIYQ
ncbi:SDR family NAD(P)-dependent oxidoreductase [Mucilaginibacter arboris]|uniref:SDR family NAD(P)-dependent oxidoreductase n=1 Tax=Mucilaginibacter arboris TaxID=2682090 RepID=A0A7K1SZM4_9SPHI|nr:SDR family NAD(P)-dependent oxidoreductase [Mucilaginibacter arboris]MVN22766.1 SDR family NAD(P)-dependent oxidoreductase [Mucilaginibacter arboris]